MTLISAEGGLPCWRIQKPEDVGNELVDLLGSLPRETLIAITLGPEQRVLGMDVVAMDSSWRTSIELRDVFAGVCRRGGAAVIVAHNQPFGSPIHSAADLHFTYLLLEAGKVSGIEVLDHLIVTSESWRSLKESTRLWAPGEGTTD